MVEKLKNQSIEKGKKRKNLSITAHGQPTFQQIVRSLLIKRGKSTTDLGNYFKMTRQGVYKQLNSEKPSLYFVPMLAEYLDVSVYELFADTDTAHIYRKPLATPIFNVFRNRVELNAERVGLSLDQLAEKVNLAGDKLVEKLDYFESGGDPLLQKKENVVFLVRLVELLGKTFEEFFFLKLGTFQGHLEFEEQLPESQITLSLKGKDNKSTDDVLSETVADIRVRVDNLKSMVHYYIRAYPEDSMSKYLHKFGQLDTFGFGSKEMNNLIEIIRKHGK